MKIRATPSSAQALASANPCKAGNHEACSGRVYVGHAFEEGAQYEPCRCPCHHALPKAA